MHALRLDIENVGNKIGYPALLVLTFLTLLPLSTGYIDCRISCRRCHENTEHPSVLEVYCAMCEECKQRRRERAQGRSSTTRTTASQMTPLVRMRDGYEDSGEYTHTHLMPASPAAQPQQAATTQPPPMTQTPPPPPPPPPPPRAPALQLQPNTQQQLQPPPNMQLVQLSQQQPLPPLAPPQASLQMPGMQQMQQMQQIQRQAYQPPSYGWPTDCPTPPPCSDSEEEIDYLRRTTTTTTTTTTTLAPTTPPCPPAPPCMKKRKPPMPMMMGCMPCMPMCPCPMFSHATHDVMMLHATQPPPSPPDYHYLYVGLPKNALRS